MMKTQIQLINHLTKIIQREVGYFNGWHVSDEAEKESCEKAAAKVLKYLNGKFDENRINEWRNP